MKSIPSVSILLAIIAIALPSGASAQLDVDCDSVAERVRVAIETKPDNVLTIVEDALVAYNGCVGAIVRTAITTKEADADMVKQIVMVAATASNQDSKEIAEAAVEAAPNHADAVRAAFAEVKKDEKPVAAIPAATTRETKAKPVVQSTTEVAGRSESGSPAAAPEPETDKIVVADDGGKTVVGESGKVVIGDSGKGVISDYDYDYSSGKGLMVDPYAVNQPGVDPGVGGSQGSHSSLSGQEFNYYGAADISGIYLIPPVASAPPVEKEVEERIVVRRRFVSKPRTIIRSVPMSPTSP